MARWPKENEYDEALFRLAGPQPMRSIFFAEARFLFEEREDWRKFNGGYQFQKLDYWTPERQRAEIEKLRHG